MYQLSQSILYETKFELNVAILTIRNR